MYELSESSSSNGPYRSRRGLILGVCRGLAEHLNFSVFWMRVIWVALALFTGLLPFVIVAYIVLALVLKPEPVTPFHGVGDREFYNSYVTSRPLALERLRRTYESLEQRIERLESVVTSRDFDWERRLQE